MGFSGLKEGVDLGDDSGAVDYIIVSGEGDYMIGLRKILDTRNFLG
jgi:hypothetical protein